MTDVKDYMNEDEEVEVEVIDPEIEKQKENMKEHLLDEFSDSALFNIVKGKDLEHKLWTKSVLLIDKIREYSDSEAADIIGAKDRSFVNNRRRYFENIISPITYENENGTSYRYSYKSVFVLKMIQVLTDGEPKIYQPAKLRDALAGKLGTLNTPREKQPIDQLYDMMGSLERKFEALANVQKQQYQQLNQVLEFKNQFTELFMQVGLIEHGEEMKLLPSEKFEGLKEFSKSAEVLRELAASADGVSMATLIQDIKELTLEKTKEKAYEFYFITQSDVPESEKATAQQEFEEILKSHEAERADINRYVKNKYKVEVVNAKAIEVLVEETSSRSGSDAKENKGFIKRFKAALDAFKG